MSRSEYIKTKLQKLQEQYPENNSTRSTDLSLWYEYTCYDWKGDTYNIAKIMKKISKLLKQADENLTQKEEAWLLREQHKEIYVIIAIPGDTTKPSHEVGYFKTQEEAQKRLVNKTCDWNEVVWLYHIESRESEDVTDWHMTHLGETLPQYPY